MVAQCRTRSQSASTTAKSSKYKMRYCELLERQPTKPSPPLSAAKARREQARKARLIAQAQDAREVCARKVHAKQKQMFESGDPS